MIAAAWNRIGFAWSVNWLAFSTYEAVTEQTPIWAVAQAACAAVHLAGAIVCLRGLLTELRAAMKEAG